MPQDDKIITTITKMSHTYLFKNDIDIYHLKMLMLSIDINIMNIFVKYLYLKYLHHYYYYYYLLIIMMFVFVLKCMINRKF